MTLALEEMFKPVSQNFSHFHSSQSLDIFTVLSRFFSVFLISVVTHFYGEIEIAGNFGLVVAEISTNFEFFGFFFHST
jgi:hypothetical protein